MYLLKKTDDLDIHCSQYSENVYEYGAVIRSNMVYFIEKIAPREQTQKLLVYKWNKVLVLVLQVSAFTISGGFDSATFAIC